MRVVVCAILAISMAVTLSAAAQSSADSKTDTAHDNGEHWFNLMAEALNELNFEASFVYVQGDRIEPYQWVHTVDRQGQQFEWLMQMNGPGFRALRVDDVVSHFHPATNSYSIRSRAISNMIPTAFSQPFTHVAAYYRAVAVGGARVLDRKAQHIRLISKDNQRYGFSVWVDRQNGLPLKILMMNHDGEIMEQLQLTNLSIREQAEETIAELNRVQTPPLLSEMRQQQPPKLPQQPQWSPAGFELLNSQHHQLLIEGTPVDHYVFSDGLAEYSVYITEPNPDMRHGMTLTGPHTLYSQPVAGLLVTVVGQIPLEVAKQIASSVQ